MIIAPPLTEADIQRAIHNVEMAAIYLADGAPNTAKDRLMDVMPVIETWAEQRASLFDLLEREANPA